MPLPETDRIDWSYSNARLYETCPRSLYFKQFTNNEVRQPGTTVSEYVGSLGSLIGRAVHRGIASQIDRWRVGKQLSLQDAESVAFETLEVIAPSEDDQNSLDIDVTTVKSTVTKHLQRFFRTIWQRFQTHQYISHEWTTTFDVAGNDIWVKADLCTRNQDGVFVISDWKTRSPGLFENHTLQLKVYALWAREEFEPNTDRIRVQHVFTSNGEVVRYSVSPSDLDHLSSRIITDTREWNDDHSISNFPAKPTPKKCSECQFTYQCEAGQEVID